MGSRRQSAFLQRGQQDQDVVQADDAGVPVSGAEPCAKEGRDVFAQVAVLNGFTTLGIPVAEVVGWSRVRVSLA
jgi:hypothetical protein